MKGSGYILILALGIFIMGCQMSSNNDPPCHSSSWYSTSSAWGCDACGLSFSPRIQQNPPSQRLGWEQRNIVVTTMFSSGLIGNYATCDREMVWAKGMVRHYAAARSQNHLRRIRNDYGAINVYEVIFRNDDVIGWFIRNGDTVGANIMQWYFIRRE